MSWIARLAAGALDPDRVQTALARIAQAWPADFPPLDSILDASPAAQRQLAIRIGFPTREAFLARYQTIREAIHAWCSSL